MVDFVTSPTKLDEACMRRYYYSNVKRYRASTEHIERVGTAERKAGSAFGEVMEALLGHRKYDLRDIANETTRQRVQNALTGVPEWMWELPDPVAEDELECVYTVGSALEPIEVKVKGRPDAWYIERLELTPGAGPEPAGIHILEFKTTKGNKNRVEEKLDFYELWSNQPLFYAVMMYDSDPKYRTLPIYRRHMVFGLDQKTGYSAIGDPKLISPQMIDWGREQMLSQISSIYTPGVWPARTSILCNYCEFQDVCTVERSGGDPELVLEQQFEPDARYLPNGERA